MNTKQCSVCEQELSLENFYRKGDRVESCCKTCKKTKRSEHYAEKKTTEDVMPRLKKILDILYESESQVLDTHLATINSLLAKYRRLGERIAE